MEGKTEGAPKDGIVPVLDRSSEKSITHSSSDIEKQAPFQTQQLERKLKSRHLQFVAIGTCTGPSRSYSSADTF